jgi:hypothetical protein
MPTLPPRPSLRPHLPLVLVVSRLMAAVGPSIWDKGTATRIYRISARAQIHLIFLGSAFVGGITTVGRT